MLAAGRDRSAMIDLTTAVIGRLAGQAADGRPLVTLPGMSGPPMPAEALWSEKPPDWSRCRGRRALLVLAEGEPSVPVVIGLLDPPAASAPRQHVAEPADGVPAPNAPAPMAPTAPRAPVAPVPSSAAAAAPARPEILHLEGGRELILECGKARIALRADGRIEILGGYLISRSTGPHKIKGASVQIN
jgi:hypothetical protein